ncbi:hypothetical protein B296_00043080 [Ensete ventricosum]|uniref:Uncharacterized protein n=1 Tax=Ensete ventricosum TaxID=4639 RepID=A0A426ZBG8_ENSVE|nr:hypothetical protein B296_00043080 [Ensete ventricosum]
MVQPQRRTTVLDAVKELFPPTDLWNSTSTAGTLLLPPPLLSPSSLLFSSSLVSLYLSLITIRSIALRYITFNNPYLIREETRTKKRREAQSISVSPSLSSSPLAVPSTFLAAP